MAPDYPYLDSHVKPENPHLVTPLLQHQSMKVKKILGNNARPRNEGAGFILPQIIQTWIDK
jgi:hypothetical protein